MAIFEDIIKSGIVSNDWDAYWGNIFNNEHPQSAKAVLAITGMTEAGSADEAQLRKILEACKLTTDQYTILQLKPGQKAAWHRLKEVYAPRAVLLFGIQPNQLGMSILFKFNGPNHFDGCIVIPSLSVEEMEKQPEAKKRLWNDALKPVFVDKTYGEI